VGDLDGQIVVVIGGSAGIGLETARRARSEGTEVILAARNPDRLEHAAEEVGAHRTAAFDANDAKRSASPPTPLAPEGELPPGLLDHLRDAAVSGDRARTVAAITVGWGYEHLVLLRRLEDPIARAAARFTPSAAGTDNPPATAAVP
jgi:Zn-dependent alcohol dehydrogenase